MNDCAVRRKYKSKKRASTSHNVEPYRPSGKFVSIAELGAQIYSL